MNLLNDFNNCTNTECVFKHTGSCVVMEHDNNEDNSILNQPDKGQICMDECPICMDDIDPLKNRLITECGHIFHTSCLMKNAALNGFGCPMCRTVMAEEELETDDESDDEPDELYSDYALRGMRLLFQSYENDDDDTISEDTDSDDTTENSVQVPSINYLMEQMQIHHITPERLLKCILSSNYDGYPSFEQDNDAIFNLLDTIIIDFVPETEEINNSQTEIVETNATEIVETNYIFPYDANYDDIQEQTNAVELNNHENCEDNSDDMIILPESNDLKLYNKIGDSLNQYYEIISEVKLFHKMQDHLKKVNNNELNHNSAINSWFI